MKIQGPKNPQVEILSNTKSLKQETVKEVKTAETDKVDAGVSQSLQYLEKAIQETHLSLEDIHSFIDEERLDNVLVSLERVESKRPRLTDEDLLHLADKTASAMEAQSESMQHLHHSPSPNRVAELLT